MKNLKPARTIGHVLELAATAALVAAVIVTFSTLLRGHGPELPAGPELLSPSTATSIAGAPALGRADAEVVLMVYSNFECPYCGAFARTILPELEARSAKTGKVRLVFPTFLVAMHPQARKAREAGVGTERRGTFWQTHDAECADRAHLGEPARRAEAQRFTLSMPAFDTRRAGKSGPADRRGCGVRQSLLGIG